jgi:hypothetical protein
VKKLFLLVLLAQVIPVGYANIAIKTIVFPGCTDPFALNYNEDATEDDGTCVYSIGPDPIIIDITVLEETCQVFDAGILSSYVYQATLVNIGTEAVTNFCLSDFLGTTFNCFNGVSNLSVWMQPGDTLTVTGNINGPGTWVAGQGNYMTVTSVPGEIITANNNFVFYMPEGVDCAEPPEYCDTLVVYVTEIDTLIEYVELPPDTYCAAVRHVVHPLGVLLLRYCVRGCFRYHIYYYARHCNCYRD